MVELTIGFCVGSFALGFTMGALYYHFALKMKNHEEQKECLNNVSYCEEVRNMV